MISCNRINPYIFLNAALIHTSDATGIEGHVEAFQGPGGLPFVRLSHACGSSVEVSLFGAQITSFKQASGDEVLYVRPDAVYDRSKPIAGGIPICFPQFGPGAIQQHGFARNVDWSVSDSSADPQPDDRDPEVQLLLRETPETLKIWCGVYGRRGVEEVVFCSLQDLVSVLNVYPRKSHIHIDAWLL